MLSIQIDSKIFWMVNSPSVEQHQIVLFCKPYENEFCTVIAKEEQPQEIIVVEPRVQTELALENKLIKINGIWAQLVTWQLDKKWIINRAFLEFSHKKKMNKRWQFYFCQSCYLFLNALIIVKSLRIKRWWEFKSLTMDGYNNNLHLKIHNFIMVKNHSKSHILRHFQMRHFLVIFNHCVVVY